MKFKLMLMLFLVSIYSCNTDNKKFNKEKFRREVPRYNKILTIIPPSEELSKQLNLVGSKYIGNFSLKVNTKKTKYTYFIAISNSIHINKFEINSFKLLGGCFFYQPYKTDKDSFHLESIDIDIVFDERISKALNNDSIYVSLHNDDLFTFPNFEGGLVMYDNNFEQKSFIGKDIISLFSGQVWDKNEKDENGHHANKSFVIGVIFHDCGKDEFNDIIKTYNFARFIKWKIPEALSIEECKSNRFIYN